MGREDHSLDLLNEVLRIILVVIGLLILLSLLGYHSTDPSPIDVSTGGEQHNWIGIVGAVVASILFQFFGLAAFLLPLIIGLGGWFILKSHGLRIPLLKAICFLVLMCSVTALFYQLISGSGIDYLQNVRDHSAGGLLGHYLFHFVRSGVQTTGALIVWGALFIVSSMAVLELSLEESVRRLRGEEGFLSWIRRRKDTREAKKQQTIVTKAGNQRETTPQTATAKASSAALSEQTLNELSITVADDAKPPVIIKTGNASPAGNGTSPAVTKPSESSTEQAAKTQAKKVEVVSIPSSAQNVSSAKEARPAEARQPKIDIKPPTREIPAVGGTTKSNASQPSSATKREPAKASNSTGVDSLIERKPPDRVMEIDDFDVEQSASSKPEREKKRSRKQTAKYDIPLPDMLNAPELVAEAGEKELLDLAHQLEAKSAEFSVIGHVEHIRPGPVVTTFEFKPDPGVKYSRITGLVDDLCLAMRAESIRIDRIPGKSTVGIEVPNAERATIYLRDVIESKAFQNSKSKLTLALGKTIGGEIYIADLTKMPHLLIAGATGAGKSVGLNSIVMSILFKASPDEVKFIMVDPKRLELGLYEGIPHLLTPIVTDPKRASNALRWAVNEMENRYRTLAGFGVRNIDQYNREIALATTRNPSTNEDEQPVPLPYIVVVIDELADLMMVASNDVEASITRLAQMARAVGIHLVLATQRPSVDVITGLIKANFPSRIAFRVSSKVDSRTIIDSNGAEQLLGQGDMLFLPPGSARLVRVHGSFVDEKEINKVIEQIKRQAEPVYDETVTMSEREVESVEGGVGDRDEYYVEALRIVVQMGRASTSVLQRRLHIGYGRAAAILDCMEAEGLIGPSEGSKPREVRPEAKEWLERAEQISPDDL